MKSRWTLHLFFWLAYTLVYAYLSTSFPQPSDLAYEWLARFGRFWRNECLMLPLKLVATYVFLYVIVPRFWMKGKWLPSILTSLGLLIGLSLLSRLMTYYVLYPMTYGEFPEFELISARRVLYSALDIGSAVALAATMILLQNRREGQQREALLEKEKLEAELNFLKAQLQPHFLFNTLNNLYVLARKQSEQTAPVVLKLSQLLRFILYECAKPRISVAQEWKVIQDYLELEQLRYGDRLQLAIESNATHAQQQIAPLLLLPLVENAFTHGASQSRFSVHIQLSLHIEAGELRFFLRNPKEPGQEIQAEGIGLSNLRRQLVLLYPNRHELRLQDQGDHFETELRLTLDA